MKKYDTLWNDINNLLALLRSSGVERAIRDYYAAFGNSAPPELLNDYVRQLQERLDEAKS